MARFLVNFESVDSVYNSFRLSKCDTLFEEPEPYIRASDQVC